jgi:cell wall assembly regulator SMI1
LKVYFNTSWASKHSKPNLTEDEIKKVEVALGISFPKEYKEIVRKYNGALIEPNVIDFNDEEEVFEMFIDLLPNQEFNIVSTVKTFQKRERLPKKVIPIATDPGGNYFCYDFRISESHPPIVFFDHELEWDNDNLTYVRPNLTELLNDLRD